MSFRTGHYVDYPSIKWRKSARNLAGLHAKALVFKAFHKTTFYGSQFYSPVCCLRVPHILLVIVTVYDEFEVLLQGQVSIEAFVEWLDKIIDESIIKVHLQWTFVVGNLLFLQNIQGWGIEAPYKHQWAWVLTISPVLVVLWKSIYCNSCGYIKALFVNEVYPKKEVLVTL